MQDKPQRIQRKRTKGWRMPPNTVSVTRPGKWGNIFVVGTPVSIFEKSTREMFFGNVPDLCVLTPRMCVKAHMIWLEKTAEGRAVAEMAKIELPGMDLACFCPLDSPCHADNLLKVANQ